MEYDTDELLAEISDHWIKDHDSNLYKLLNIFNQDMQQISDNSEKVDQIREIANSSGTTLELHGKDLNVPRISNDDEFYRFLIHIKSMLASSSGSYSDIYNIISSAFKTNEKIKIWRTEPHHIMISLPPISNLTAIQQKILLDSLQELVTLGQWIDGIQWIVQGETQNNFLTVGFCSTYCSGILN